MKVVKEGLRLPFTTKAPALKGTVIDSGKSPEVMNAVQEFLEKGALEPTTTKGFTARLFVDQRGEKARPILDCRPLNAYLNPRHFKMEDLKMLATIVQPGDFLVKIDLKDAYLHIPIHKDHKKYLQVRVGGKTYQFKALPFGLNVAPQIFSRVLKAALLPLREKSVRMVAYLDDICVVASTEAEAKEQGMQVVTHLQNLGFIVTRKRLA